MPTGLGNSKPPCMATPHSARAEGNRRMEEEKVIRGQTDDSAGVRALFCEL